MPQPNVHDYPGPRASKTYDVHFVPSHPVPHLKSHVPQGLATWPRWNGTDDLLVIASYSPDDHDHAYLIGVDARSGRHVGTAKVAASHAGGVAIFESLGWAYLSSGDKYRVRKYPLDRLKQAITDSVFIKQKGPDIEVFGASFLSSHSPSGTLWAGRFDADARSFMHCYQVGDNGALRRCDGVWQVPRATQGLVVTEDMFIYSSSYGRNTRGRMYLVRRGDGPADLDESRVISFFAPSMSEGMTLCGAHVYVVFESGASEYRNDRDKPRNIIGRLHRAALSSLADLRPVGD
jgi:hypothetical protein